MIVVVIALFAWLTHSSVAGAASATPSTNTPAATQPYGPNDSAAPAANGDPCPKDEQGSGGSGSQPSAPSQSPSQSSPNSSL
jgi:hypothetical protein